LEPLSGYLWLGAALAGRNPERFNYPQRTYAAAFNFGPALSSNRTVAELVAEILKHWPGAWEDRSDPKAVHEAKLLNLATDKAFHLLGWSPVWDFSATIAQTASWYTATAKRPEVAPATTAAQIDQFESNARALGLPWAA
jgi:CDP-glucose 4,6-dehydratase